MSAPASRSHGRGSPATIRPVSDITGPVTPRPQQTCSCKDWGRRCSPAARPCKRGSWPAWPRRPPQPATCRSSPGPRRAGCPRPGPGRHRGNTTRRARKPGRRPANPRLRHLRGRRPGRRDQPDRHPLPTLTPTGSTANASRSSHRGADLSRQLGQAQGGTITGSSGRPAPTARQPSNAPRVGDRRGFTRQQRSLCRSSTVTAETNRA